MATNTKTAPKAHLIAKGTTPVVDLFLKYIKEQTGYDADPMSVQLGSTLRGEFQKSQMNQKRIADAAARKKAAAEARASRAAERAAAKVAKAAEPKAEAKAEKKPATPKVAK
jgi:hypothetical protein